MPPVCLFWFSRITPHCHYFLSGARRPTYALGLPLHRFKPSARSPPFTALSPVLFTVKLFFSPAIIRLPPAIYSRACEWCAVVDCSGCLGGHPFFVGISPPFHLRVTLSARHHRTSSNLGLATHFRLSSRTLPSSDNHDPSKTSGRIILCMIRKLRPTTYGSEPFGPSAFHQRQHIPEAR